jgi:hypothetical protein
VGCSEGIPISPFDVSENEGVGGVMVDESEVEEEHEAKKPKAVRDPGSPTEEMIKEHDLTHLPYRSWCPQCIQGKAPDDAHRKTDKDEKCIIPQVVFDYGFLAKRMKVRQLQCRL